MAFRNVLTFYLEMQKTKNDVAKAADYGECARVCSPRTWRKDALPHVHKM